MFLLYTLENEFHFLFECNLYNDLRANYIPNYYTSNPNMVKTIEMMMTNDPTDIRNIATYIYKSFELHVRENCKFVRYNFVIIQIVLYVDTSCIFSLMMSGNC